MHDGDALQGHRHDPSIEPFTPANVYLAPMDWSDHFPNAGLICERHEIILQDVFLVQCLRSKR